MAKRATKTTTTRTTRKAVASGDDTPETRATTAEKKAAAKKLFDNADTAAMAGLPPDITVEQRENQVRLGALGY
jgi:hypothetical protein